MRDMISNRKMEEEVLVNMGFGVNKDKATWNVYGKVNEKKYRIVNTKRQILPSPETRTLPWGYQPGIANIQHDIKFPLLEADPLPEDDLVGSPAYSIGAYESDSFMDTDEEQDIELDDLPMSYDSNT